MTLLNQTLNPPTAPTADTPQPPVKLAPEDVFTQLRTLRAQLNDELSPLTKQQRRQIAERGRRQSNPIVQSSINIMGAADLVSQAVGVAPEEARQICDDSNRWTAVADELRSLLNGVEGANLVRQQRIADIANRAYTIGASLAGDPANAALVPHVEETKRLRKLARRKKSAAPQNPSPAPSPSPSGPTPQPHAADAPAKA
jgi:hypothetical protein